MFHVPIFKPEKFLYLGQNSIGWVCWLKCEHPLKTNNDIPKAADSKLLGFIHRPCCVTWQDIGVQWQNEMQPI